MLSYRNLSPLNQNDLIIMLIDTTAAFPWKTNNQTRILH